MTKIHTQMAARLSAGPEHVDFGFDRPLSRAGLSTAKWEYEIARKGDPTLLCFGTAEMDFRSAPPICAALEQVSRAGHFGYPHKRTSYFEAVMGYFERHFDWRLQKDWIASGVSIYPSMQLIIEELTALGDEILFQTPVHHIFQEIISANGRVAVENPLIKRNGRYEMDFDDLAAKITERTRLFLLCSPHNPVGRVWDRGELDQLSALCLARGIVVVTDEVYCGLVFGGVSFTPFASLSAAASMNSITLVSASKSFNVTGLKHSLVIAENPELRAAYMHGLQRTNLHFGGCMFGQAAAEAAFRDCDEWSAALVRYLEDNFAFMQSILAEKLPIVTVTKPEATYFAWLDFSRLGLSIGELQRFFEDEAHVTVTFGEYLGTGGEGHVRFNLGTSKSLIEEGLERVVKAYERRTAS